MKDPMRVIDRFCYRHPDFGIRDLSKYIAIASGVVWILSLVNTVLMGYLTFSMYHILHGQIWRLVSFIIYPVDSSFLGLIAIYFYYWIGSTLEQYWGTAKFNVYIVLNMLLTILFGAIFYVLGSNIQLTAGYVFLAMFFAFAVYFPDTQVLFMFIIPIKIKWLAYVDAAFFAYEIITGSFPYNLLPVVAILGFFIFCGGELWKRRPKRASRNTINFRREAARIRYEQRDKLYNHKCAVCGKTDTDYPGLEFRYCSRCAGYHCFCIDHINNHIHFTE